MSMSTTIQTRVERRRFSVSFDCTPPLPTTMTGHTFASSICSPNQFGSSRKNAVKYILEALRSINDVDSLYEILSCTKKLAEDIGEQTTGTIGGDSNDEGIVVTQVQIDTLEKFVVIIEYLISNVENADILIKDYLFQPIVQTVGHGNNRVSEERTERQGRCAPCPCRSARRVKLRSFVSSN